MEPPSVVINECIADISQSIQASMPRASSIKRSVRQKRNEICAAPPCPTDHEHLIIPNRYKVYEPMGGREENFLLVDSGPGRGRIIIFGRESWLQYLISSSWYTDGTFNIAPQLFHKVFCILAKKHSGVHPICYALLPNEEHATYVRMFEMLMSLVSNLNPHYIHCDFEQAMINAVRECFPEATVKGCFFHLVQSMQRHILSSGLRRRYNTDPEFASYAKMIAALAFVPCKDLDSFIEALANNLPSELETILNWFECNYVSVYNRRGNRRNPFFPYDLWNIYETTLNDEDRTNNNAEACHRKLAYELGSHHPTQWKFIEILNKVQKGRDLYMEQLIAGNEPATKLKKYQHMNKIIKKIVSEYGNERSCIEYLRGIAHNFQM